MIFDSILWLWDNLDSSDRHFLERNKDNRILDWSLYIFQANIQHFLYHFCCYRLFLTHSEGNHRVGWVKYIFYTNKWIISNWIADYVYFLTHNMDASTYYWFKWIVYTCLSLFNTNFNYRKHFLNRYKAWHNFDDSLSNSAALQSFLVFL